MVDGDNLKWYKLGKKSTQRFVRAAARQFGKRSEIGRRLGYAAPHLCGSIDEVDLAEYELHAILEWLEDPEGPPPSGAFRIYAKMVQQCRDVLDDSELEKLAGSENGDLL
ncbi:MAG: hypothetical protein F7C07_00225 [Desulfurococcales archaeon]|nr:hypothetical protein [Desulfurococcales archaeon]